MYFTRQDHIDRMISSIDPCPGSRVGRQTDVRVLFTNNEWICSSGHCSDANKLPNLRTPDRCPVTWVQENALEVMLSITVEICRSHEDGENPDWGQDGHLYNSGLIRVNLCLPHTAWGSI